MATTARNYTSVGLCIAVEDRCPNGKSVILSDDEGTSPTLLDGLWIFGSAAAVSASKRSIDPGPID